MFRKQVRFVATDLSNPELRACAFRECEAIAHCAGINREIGEQTFQRVQVDATRNVVESVKKAGVRKIVLMSFLRARPNCGSRYHESKWAAEEFVRGSGLDLPVIKAGMVYGRGDHRLDHLSHSVHTLPPFAGVGFRQRSIRPLAIEDLVHVLRAALIDGRLFRQTVSLTGTEPLYLSDAARRVSSVLQRRLIALSAPVWLHYVLAQIFELTMKLPLVLKAQVRILSERVLAPALPFDALAGDLAPKRRFSKNQIRSLPDPGPFSWRDLRCCA